MLLKMIYLRSKQIYIKQENRYHFPITVLLLTGIQPKTNLIRFMHMTRNRAYLYDAFSAAA